MKLVGTAKIAPAVKIAEAGKAVKSIVYRRVVHRIPPQDFGKHLCFMIRPAAAFVNNQMPVF